MQSWCVQRGRSFDNTDTCNTITGYASEVRNKSKRQKIGSNEKSAKSQKPMSEDSSEDFSDECKKRTRSKEGKKREKAATSSGSDTD